MQNESTYYTMNKKNIPVITNYEHEIQTWERALDFYAQENSYLKTWLSELVDNSSDKAFLVKAEYFDSRFLFTDDYIKAFKQDLRTQLQSILNIKTRDNNFEQEMDQSQQKFRQEMKLFEKALAKLRTEFTSKMIKRPDIN